MTEPGHSTRVVRVQFDSAGGPDLMTALPREIGAGITGNGHRHRIAIPGAARRDQRRLRALSARQVRHSAADEREQRPVPVLGFGRHDGDVQVLVPASKVGRQGYPGIARADDHDVVVSCTKT